MNPDVGLAAGRGPVYPVLRYPASPPDPNAVVRYTNNGEGIRIDGWWYYKTMWIRDPSYRGRALIRGRRLDGPGGLRFQPGGGPEPTFATLRLPRPKPSDDEWAFMIGSTLIRRAGCYGLQIDGDDFSRLVVFKAVP